MVNLHNDNFVACRCFSGSEVGKSKRDLSFGNQIERSLVRRMDGGKCYRCVGF